MMGIESGHSAFFHFFKGSWQKKINDCLHYKLIAHFTCCTLYFQSWAASVPDLRRSQQWGISFLHAQNHQCCWPWCSRPKNHFCWWTWLGVAHPKWLLCTCLQSTHGSRYRIWCCEWWLQGSWLTQCREGL